MYNAQFNNFSKQREIPLPGALIEIKPISTDNYSQRVQHSTIEVSVYIGNEIYEGTDYLDAQQDAALEHLTLLDKVFYCLDNMSTTLPASGQTNNFDENNFQISNCRRKSINMNVASSACRVSVITFELCMTDITAMKRTQDCYNISPILTGITFNSQI